VTRARARCALLGALLGFATAPAFAGRPVDTAAYPWLADWKGTPPPMVRLDERFPPPAGFSRAEAPSESLTVWLRGLPVRTDRATVLAYDGRPLWRPAVAVIALDVGDRDLQQCADTALRLHAEYLWHRGLAGGAAYHFTSGDRSSWRDWRRGERFKIRGARVKRVRGRARPNDHRTYRGWLTHLFRYAGTRSLSRDSDPVAPAAQIEPGDFFVQPGGPGHAVIVLDVATHADGRRAALIGQSYIPAEELHVLGDDHERVLRGAGGVDQAWFLLPNAAHPTLKTPSWAPFNRREARRFRTPAGGG